LNYKGSCIPENGDLKISLFLSPGLYARWFWFGLHQGAVTTRLAISHAALR
jgi:hypothetical protein